jgi:hypothetical protein
MCRISVESVGFKENVRLSGRICVRVGIMVRLGVLMRVRVRVIYV